MTPDWYVDPLGRYEGRYFDGEQWTAQVKDRGRLVIDPDWDRPAPAPAASDDLATDETGVVTTIETASPAAAATATEATVEGDVGFAEPVRAAVEPVAPVLDPIDETAVAAGTVDFSQESPARQVAVLDSPDPAPVSEAIVGDEDESGGRRWLYVLGLAILALALLLILLPRLLGNDETADDNDDAVPAASEAAAVDNDAPDAADEGALPATEPADDAASVDATGTDSDTDTAADGSDDATGDDAAGSDDADDAADDGTPAVDPNSDALMVGSLEILNAKPVLRDLAIWHESSLTGRDITLGDDANCWLGSIGEAVVQNAHCGPVAATPGAEPRFDLVPLRFEDVSDGVIQIRPITDAVVIDAVLPNGLQLVGSEGPIDPASFAVSGDATAPDASEPDTSEPADSGPEDAERGSRGERETGD